MASPSLLKATAPERLLAPEDKEESESDDAWDISDTESALGAPATAQVKESTQTVDDWEEPVTTNHEPQDTNECKEVHVASSDDV